MGKLIKEDIEGIPFTAPETINKDVLLTKVDVEEESEQLEYKSDIWTYGSSVK